MAFFILTRFVLVKYSRAFVERPSQGTSSLASRLTTVSLDIYTRISYSTVVLYSRDRYEIIGLLKLSHSIKQPCSSVCQKKALEMHQKCLKNAVRLLNKMEN